jgi:acetyl esterase/lipase
VRLRRSLAWIFAVVLVGTEPGFVLGQGPRTAATPVSFPAVEKDIPYADGGDEQKLDLYLPREKGFATVVFTYGGGWHSGSRKSVAAVGETLQGLGFGCALLSHRLSPRDKFPAQADDVSAGFAWVKRHIADRGGDPGHVFLAGHSSGAQLSLLLATDPRYLAKHELSPADVGGVVGLSSPVDLEPRKDGQGFGNVLMAGRGADVFSRNADVMKDASPIQHVSKGLPPVLLVVGERDFPMLEGDARAFVQKAKDLDRPAALFVARGCDHMGVVKALVEGKSTVQEQVVKFLSHRADAQHSIPRPDVGR